jgi:hypothetical protein
VCATRRLFQSAWHELIGSGCKSLRALKPVVVSEGAHFARLFSVQNLFIWNAQANRQNAFMASIRASSVTAVSLLLID